MLLVDNLEKTQRKKMDNGGFGLLDWAMVLFIAGVVISSVAGFVYYAFIDKE